MRGLHTHRLVCAVQNPQLLGHLGADCHCGGACVHQKLHRLAVDTPRREIVTIVLTGDSHFRRLRFAKARAYTPVEHEGFALAIDIHHGGFTIRRQQGDALRRGFALAQNALLAVYFYHRRIVE